MATLLWIVNGAVIVALTACDNFASRQQLRETKKRYPSPLPACCIIKGKGVGEEEEEEEEVLKVAIAMPSEFRLKFRGGTSRSVKED